MVLSVQWKDFGRSHYITALKGRQKIIKTLLPVVLKSSSQCTMEQSKCDAVTEVGSITVLREKLKEAVLQVAQCPCPDGFAFPLQWLHISTWSFQVFHVVGRFYILIWWLRNRKTKQKSWNSKATIRADLSSFHICAHFIRPQQEIEGKAFSFFTGSIATYSPSRVTAQRQCKAQSL